MIDPIPRPVPWPREVDMRTIPACIIVSNRGPIEYVREEGGEYERRLGAGGLVTGLLSGIHRHPTLWISLAMTEADRRDGHSQSQEWIYSPASPAGLAVRMVDVPPDTFARYYNEVANRVLWPVQHYLLESRLLDTGWDRQVLDDWDAGYRVVNEAVAHAIEKELRRYGGHIPVLFQDYHLYLAPGSVRAAHPHARLSHTSCIPWPEARYWERCPGSMVEAIYQGMAANDLLNFQTARDAHNFLDGATAILPGTRVAWDGNRAGGELALQGRRVRVRVRPLALSPAFLHDMADASDVRAKWLAIRRGLPADDAHRVLLRVDRLEPTKNILRGFDAFAQVLRDHAELRERVTFLCLLVPSRQSLAEYQSYEREVRRMIEDVNRRYETHMWRPIVAIFGHDRARALACLCHYDVLLVNPIIDGLNLVAKEGGLLNSRDGSVVLSRTAGVHERLNGHVLSISPLDVAGTARAIHEALCMPIADRRRHAAAIRALLTAEDGATWLTDILRDLYPSRSVASTT